MPASRKRQRRLFVNDEVFVAQAAATGSRFTSRPSHWDVIRVISRCLIYSAYLGGSSNEETTAISVDGQGQAYVAGATRSRDFPVTAGAFQGTHGGDPGNVSGFGGDSFVAKLNASGSTLMYATYVGGQGEDSAAAIAVDGSGNAIVADATTSSTFPVTAGTVQTKYGGSASGIASGGDATAIPSISRSWW